jgi:mannosyltransferase
MADDAASVAEVEASRAQAGLASKRARGLAPIGVGLVAFVIGLIELTAQPFSWDEKVSVETARQSVSGIWHAARTTEAPHFVYYLLLKPWLAAVGTSEWLARFPSVCFGALTALVVTALGTRLYGSRAGITAGLVLASSEYVVHWWQWARSYSLALLLVTVATYAFVRAMERESTAWTALWVAGIVAACWVNLFSVSVLAAHVLALLVQRPSGRLRLGAAAALAGAAVVPIVVLVATANNGQLDWIPEPTLRRVLVQTWDWSGRNPFALLAAGMGLVVVLRGIVPGSARWKSVLVLTWLAAPFVLTLILSAIQPAFDAHYLLTAAPGLALLVGAAIAALDRRPAIALASLVAAGALVQLVHFYVAPGKPLSSLF